MKHRSGNPLYTAIAAVMLAAAFATTALAHHSFAMFDNDHQIKITGTVTRFDWMNPHIYIFATGGEAGKEARAWTIEGATLTRTETLTSTRDVSVRRVTLLLFHVRFVFGGNAAGRGSPCGQNTSGRLVHTWTSRISPIAFAAR